MVTDGNQVFFRFYDPRFSLPIAEHCDEQQRTVLMGPCVQWQSRQTTVINHKPNPTFIEQAFPWWSVPESVMAGLTVTTDVTVLNLVKDIHERRPDITQSYPKSILTQKARRFADHYQGETEWLLSAFITKLEHEQQQLERAL